MTTDAPFIRRVELIIGPLREDQGGGPQNQAIRIVSSGDRKSLQVKFSVRKTLVGAPNNTIITVTNLSRETRNRLQTQLTRVQLYVGWQNTERLLLTQGALFSAVSDKNGAEIITTMVLLDGFGGISRGIANQSFAPNQQISGAVRTLAGTLPGVSVGTIDISGQFGIKGFVASDATQDVLDRLSEQYGFSWSIQNGVFQALDDQRSFNRTHVVSVRNRNLIKATPILSGPMQIATGHKIEATIDPRIQPGNQVRLESSLNPELNGVNKSHNISFEGDTDTSTFFMVIETFRLAP